MKQENKTLAHLDLKKLTWIAATLVALATFILYLPALQNGFVEVDDQLYVYRNQNIKSIDLNFFRWSLTAEVAALWHPLTMFSFALDYAIWGLNPLGYHLTNILFHTVNTFLVFILVVRLIECKTITSITPPSPLFIKEGARGHYLLIAASVTAILFGIHPLRVESVVWVAERKDVLCAFFFLLSLLSYLKYTSADNSKKSLFYASSLISFTLALMSKPMAVSLPLVLLILDFYPLKRLTRGFRGVLAEKLPFFALSILVAVATIWASKKGTALVPLGSLPLMNRFSLAANAWVLYIAKMILPFNLAPYYSTPKRINPLAFKYVAAIFIFSSITAFSLRSLKKERLFFAVWLYYLVALIPVIGIVKVGGIIMADRYSYLPSLGPFLLAGLGIAEILKKKQFRLPVITTLLLISALLGFNTIKQTSLWKDSITILSLRIKHSPNDGTALLSRGNLYGAIGDYQRAIKDFDRVIEGNPKIMEAYNNRGNCYYAVGNLGQAIEDYKKAAELDPKNAEAYYNLGFIYSRMGNNMEEAIINYKKAAALGLKEAQDYLKARGI